MTDAQHAADSLELAMRLQLDAAATGFDWPDIEPAWDKLHEEIAELRAVVDEPEAAREELGDLLFMVVNLARHLGVDPTAAIKAANAKFSRRFAFVMQNEQLLPPIGAADRLAVMEERWQQAKTREKGNSDA